MKKTLHFSLAFLLLCASASAADYEFHQIDNQLGAAYVHALNDNGEIVGFVYDVGAVKWPSHDSIATVLQQYNNGSFNEAFDINNSGSIVGRVRVDNSTVVAAYWPNETTLTELSGGQLATGINENEQVAVWKTDGHGAVWENGSLTDLPWLQNESVSMPQDINNNGITVGHAIVSGFGKGTYYQNGVVNEISGVAQFNAINGNGITVGYGGSTSLMCAIYDTNSGTLSYLSTPPLQGAAVTRCEALGVNDDGDVVGRVRVSGNNTWRAFIYVDEQLSYVEELFPNTSGWSQFWSAVDINNSGQIIGRGLLSNGSIGSFTLLPECVTPPDLAEDEDDPCAPLIDPGDDEDDPPLDNGRG